MRVAIVVFPGSNCDRDIFEAIKPLSKKEYKQVRSLCSQISPRKNHSLFLIYASLGSQECLDLILSSLSNPQAEIRLAAAVGLQRFVVSYKTLGDQETEQKILALLKDSTLKSDALAHISQDLFCTDLKHLCQPLL